MPLRDPKKFDPANAAALDAPDREAFLATAALVELLGLDGGETVVDYGAGTGRVAVAVADRLTGGEVLAVEENPQMFERLLALRTALVRPMLIEHNAVPLSDRCVDRVLAANLLHEVRGETALAEIQRILRPDGRLVVVDWERGRERSFGPPDELLYTSEEAQAELEAAGFATDRVDGGFPFHFTLIAVPGGA